MRAIAAVAVLLTVSGIAGAGSATARPAPQPDTPLAGIAACPAGTRGDAPVLLIHGTGATVEKSFGAVRQALLDDGRCVYGLDYDSTRPLSDSVDYFAAAVDRITAVNDGAPVDVIGKSQGALIARAVSLKFTDRQENPVRSVIAVSGPQYGVTLAGMTLGAAAAALPPDIPFPTPALRDMLAGSPYLTDLNSGPMTAPGVAYTMIASRDDEMVTPYTAAFIDAPNVTNILLQDGCPEDHSGHLAESTDPRSVDLVLHALDPQRHTRIRCTANDERK
ncbi:esterase/lipase family protein [Nocardia sp. NPDC088792]|uniref:esterase/lipase family protein n=1 Tax=Nocardia sp. NPDC088792 TaxID=3364332 RepID=UPI0037F8D9EF